MSETKYTLDWQKGVTDHPDYGPVLQYGSLAPKVFLDNKDMGDDVVRCETGVNGFVDMFRRSSDGNIMINVHNKAVLDRFHGRVTVGPPSQ